MATKTIPSFWIDRIETAVGFFRLDSSATPSTPAVDDALQRQPLLYALGLSEAIAQLVDSHGWETRPVPFFYRIVRAGRFFRNASYLRRSLLRMVAFDFLAVSGLGKLIILLWQGRLPKAAAHGSVEITPVDEFGPWVDDIWHAAKAGFTLAAVRDCESIGSLYPAGDQTYLKLRVTRGEETLGWFVCLGKHWKNHPQFGRMRIGSIVDGLTLPGEEEHCLGAVVRFLSGLEIDLIVSHQSHAAYGEGMTANGMRTAPSNMTLALSPELARRLQPLDETAARFHFNRGDGDGPLQL